MSHVSCIETIDNVVKELVTEDQEMIMQEIEAKERTILIHEHGGLTFSIITNEQTTRLLQSSLRYFARAYTDDLEEELIKFHKTGNSISSEKVFDLLIAAFLYTAGLELTSWE